MRTLRLRLEIDVQADGDQIIGPAIGKAVESLSEGRLSPGDRRDVSGFFESGVSAVIHVTGFHQVATAGVYTDIDGEAW